MDWRAGSVAQQRAGGPGRPFSHPRSPRRSRRRKRIVHPRRAAYLLHSRRIRGRIPRSPSTIHLPPISDESHRVLPLTALLLTLAACGGGEEAASGSPGGNGAEAAPASSAPATAAAPASRGGSCETYGFGTSTEAQLHLKPGNRGTLPADFPEPPAGAQLCGRNELDTTFFAGGVAQNALVEHYRARLTEQGYTVDANDTGMQQGDLEISFRKADAANGSVHADADGTFSMTYTAVR